MGRLCSNTNKQLTLIPMEKEKEIGREIRNLHKPCEEGGFPEYIPHIRFGN